jgi:hypothetical protein
MGVGAPSASIQASEKSQAPNSKAPRWLFDFEAWSFSGAWMLLLGDFSNLLAIP